MSRFVHHALVLVLAIAGSAAGCGGSQSGSRRADRAQAPKLPPVNPMALRDFDAGLRALKLGGPDANQKAMRRFRSAIELDTTLWEAWHNLGAVLLQEGDLPGALEAFDEAIKINPAHLPAIAGRAETHRLAGRSSQAAKDYRRLLEAEPNSVSGYARAASLLRQGGEFEDGLDVLREGLRIAGPSSTIYVELGLIYLAQGRDELAKLVLSKAIELNAKDPAIFNALALVAMGEGDDQLAFSYFDRAAELDPNYVDTRFNKANVLLDAGDYQRARAELQAILAIDPEDMAARVALGIAHRGVGDHAKARQTWEDVVKTASGGVQSDALFNLAILELDFIMDEKKAMAALDRYLQSSTEKHSKHKEAVELQKDLGE